MSDAYLVEKEQAGVAGMQPWEKWAAVHGRERNRDQEERRATDGNHEHEHDMHVVGMPSE